MKKVGLLFSIASIILASNSNIDINKINENFDFCKLENKKVDIYVKGPFGKQKKTISLLKEYENYFLKHLNNIKVQKDVILLKIQGLFSNLKEIRKLVSKESYIYKISFFKSMTEGLISLGYLPSSFKLNIGNFQTKKSKLSIDVNTIDLAMNLASYLFPEGDIQKAIYRNLLFDSFLLSRGPILLSDKCEDMYSDTFKQTIIILGILARQGNPMAVRILTYLANRNYDKLDKFLLEDKQTSLLMKYAKNVIKTKYSKYLN